MKRKGSNAERELVSMFWDRNWAAIRIAGSGSSRFPCPDVLAGDGNVRFAVEVKSTKKSIKYISPEQMEQLRNFSSVFGAIPLIAVKFSSKWQFIDPNCLEQSKKGNYIIHKEKCKFSEFVEVLDSKGILSQQK